MLLLVIKTGREDATGISPRMTIYWFKTQYKKEILASVTIWVFCSWTNKASLFNTWEINSH